MNMKLRFSLFLILLVTTTVVYGQYSAEEKEIMKPIEDMFKGMATGDSALIHKHFEKEISMVTVFKNKEGKATLRRENSLDGFLKAVAGQQQPFNEPIWNVKIRVSGDLALVSCDYAFYLGKKFSHCGVDAWQLIKRADGWKIFHLVDTRQMEGCDVPEEIQAKFK